MTLSGKYSDQNARGATTGGPLQGLAIAQGMLVVAAGSWLVGYE